MIDQKIQDALNGQLNAEIYSAYLYLSMSNYFESLGLIGMANWMRIQWQEELTHALKFNDYLNERGGRVLLTSIEGPQTEWDSPLKAFQDTAGHERKVTGLINDLVNLAESESDHATKNFLMWYVSEQVEEEASVDAVLQKLKLVGSAGEGLLMVDNELAKRIFTPPAAGN
ncbi:MAG: ferritin [Deltaproteobacteria bacterium]|nr:ferritin [Deltaproteobacteria bacterium]